MHMKKKCFNTFGFKVKLAKISILYYLKRFHEWVYTYIFINFSSVMSLIIQGT